MKAILTFVPPGGGEQNYMLDFELPGVPSPGDYISIMKDGETGTSDFIVRRCWWHLQAKQEGQSTGALHRLVVECEFAHGMYSSEAHKRACAVYEGRGTNVPKHEASGY